MGLIEEIDENNLILDETWSDALESKIQYVEEVWLIPGLVRLEMKCDGPLEGFCLGWDEAVDAALFFEDYRSWTRCCRSSLEIAKGASML